MPGSTLAASLAVSEAHGEGSGWGGGAEQPNILSRKLKRALAKSAHNLYSSLLPPPEGQRGQSVCLMRCFLSSHTVPGAPGAECRVTLGMGAPRTPGSWSVLCIWRVGWSFQEPHHPSMSHQLPAVRASENSYQSAPTPGRWEINERPFVKLALILTWKEHFSPKYKGDDSLIRSSGFSGRHTQVLFLTLGSSLKPRGECVADLGLGNQDSDVLGVASFAHPCRDEINF